MKHRHGILLVVRANVGRQLRGEQGRQREGGGGGRERESERKRGGGRKREPRRERESERERERESKRERERERESTWCCFTIPCAGKSGGGSRSSLLLTGPRHCRSGVGGTGMHGGGGGGRGRGWGRRGAPPCAALPKVSSQRVDAGSRPSLPSVGVASGQGRRGGGWSREEGKGGK